MVTDKSSLSILATATTAGSVFVGNIVLMSVVIGVSLNQTINIHTYNGGLISISSVAFLVMISYSLISLVSAYTPFLSNESIAVDSTIKRASQLVKISLRVTTAAAILYGSILLLNLIL